MDAGGDFEFLFAEVIEVEYHGVALAAVSTRVGVEVLEEKLDALA